MEELEVIYHNHIGIFNNAVNSQYCNDLIKYFEDFPKKEERYIAHQDSEIIVKDNSIGLFDLEEKYSNFLFTDILNKKIIPKYVTKYTGFEDLFNFYNLVYDGMNVQKTNPGEGYHKWHSEWSPKPEYNQRSLVWTLYLNDVEEGGETEFLDIPFRFKPKQGSILIFPAFSTHFHRGNPPLSGSKYLATGWITTNLLITNE